MAVPNPALPGLGGESDRFDLQALGAAAGQPRDERQLEGADDLTVSSLDDGEVLVGISVDHVERRLVGAVGRSLAARSENVIGK